MYLLLIYSLLIIALFSISGSKKNISIPQRFFIVGGGGGGGKIIKTLFTLKIIIVSFIYLK